MSSRGREEMEHTQMEEGSPCGVQGMPDSPSAREFRKSLFMTPQKDKRKVPVLNLDLLYEPHDTPRTPEATRQSSPSIRRVPPPPKLDQRAHNIIPIPFPRVPEFGSTDGVINDVFLRVSGSHILSAVDSPIDDDEQLSKYLQRQEQRGIVSSVHETHVLTPVSKSSRAASLSTMISAMSTQRKRSKLNPCGPFTEI